MDLSAPPPAEEWAAHGFGCDTLTLDSVAPGERERDDVFVIPAFAEAFARWSTLRRRAFEGRGYGYSFTLGHVRNCNNCESGIGHERLEYGSKCAEGDLSFLVYSDGCTLRQSEVVFTKDCCDGACAARSPEVWMTRFLTALSKKDGARLRPLFAPGQGTEITISVGGEEPESFTISSSDDMQTAPLTRLDSPRDAILVGYTQLSCDEQFEGAEWECSTMNGGYRVKYHWAGDAEHAVLMRIDESGE